MRTNPFVKKLHIAHLKKKMKLFTRETLKHSIKPIIIMLIACAMVWYWGHYHKVSVELTLRPDIGSAEVPVKMDMTMYRGEDEVAATFSLPLSADRLAIHHLNVRPGNYTLRGIITTDAGHTHIVTQTFVVPEDDAAIELYLRKH